MGDRYAVITCLSCKKRLLLEGPHGLLRGTKIVRDGCSCGDNEVVVTTLNSYASAKKLSESTMPPVFVDLHRILRNKVASLALLTDMLALCETEAAKAELANEPQRIRNIIKWLRAIAFPNLSDFTEDEESKEEGA